MFSTHLIFPLFPLTLLHFLSPVGLVRLYYYRILLDFGGLRSVGWVLFLPPHHLEEELDDGQDQDPPRCGGWWLFELNSASDKHQLNKGEMHPHKGRKTTATQSAVTSGSVLGEHRGFQGGGEGSER
jgi:hypothetical protein